MNLPLPIDGYDFAGLRFHQARIVPWLLDTPHALLAWQAGVGKTAPLLRAWELSRERGPALVLCLNTARANWAREIGHFALDPAWPPKVMVARNKNEPFDRDGADIIVINYEKLIIPQWHSMVCTRKWGALLVDEAHRLKNPDGKTTRAVYGPVRTKQGRRLIDSAKRVWLATGTPMPNHPGELYSHCAALWPEHMIYRGHVMERWEFEAAFCEMRETEYGMAVTGGRNLDELRARLAPVVNMVKRQDVLNLPPCQVDVWPLDGDVGAAGPVSIPDLPGLMGTLEEKYGSVADIDHFDAKTLDLYLTCIQSAMSPLPTLRRETAQLKAVFTALTISDELENDSTKTVVFAIHREAISTLQWALRAYRPAVIHGDIPEAKRVAEIDRFQTDPRCRVFIGQLNCAGASINLQAANEVIFIEASWTPGDNEQALSRVYRMGQTRPVRVRFVYLPGSIDEAVSRAIRRKMATISQMFW
jgi:hypothetical protein